jgi:GAF domain-containing protein
MTARGTGDDPLRALLDVGSALVSSVDLDEAFAGAARVIGETLLVAAVEIHSFDQKQNAFFLEATWFGRGSEAGSGPVAARTPIPVADRLDLHRVVSRHEVVERRLDDPGLSSREREELQGAGRTGMLCAPLRVGLEVLGVVTLIETNTAGDGAAVDAELLQQLCDLAAVAIRNSYLLRERDERTRHMQLLLDVGRAVTSSLVLDDVLTAVCQYTGRAMDVALCDIQLYDAASDRLVYAACWERDPGPEPPIIGAVIDPDERPSNRLALEGRPLECHLDDPDLPELERAGLEYWGETSTLDYPLTYQDEVIGILGLAEYDHVRRFTYEERALFEQLGTLASIAIHNAQVFRRLEDHNRHLAAIMAIGGAWATCADAGELFSTIARKTANALGASRALLYEYDDRHDSVTLRGLFDETAATGYDTTGRAEAVADHPAYRAALESTVPIVERLSDPGLDVATRAEMEQWGEQTALSLPVAFRGEPLGILMVVHTESERLYGDDELQLAVAIAEQAAVALRAARVIGVGDAATQQGRG